MSRPLIRYTTGKRCRPFGQTYRLRNLCPLCCPGFGGNTEYTDHVGYDVTFAGTSLRTGCFTIGANRYNTTTTTFDGTYRITKRACGLFIGDCNYYLIDAAQTAVVSSLWSAASCTGTESPFTELRISLNLFDTSPTITAELLVQVLTAGGHAQTIFATTASGVVVPDCTNLGTHANENVSTTLFGYGGSATFVPYR
jgi:hypothetical protein